MTDWQEQNMIAGRGSPLSFYVTDTQAIKQS